MAIQVIQYFLKNETWNFPKTIEGVVEVDGFNVTFAHDNLLRLPNCKICGKHNEEKTTNKFWTKTYTYQE